MASISAVEQQAMYESALSVCKDNWKTHVQDFIRMRNDMAGTDGEHFVEVIEKYEAGQLQIAETQVHIAHCKAMISINRQADL
jgi:hypothetical protein